MNLKKNIRINIANQQPSKVLFFDESRFGTHSKIGYGWFERGTRPAAKIKVGYKNFYLYSSVDVSNGSNFSLILPKVNTDNMNIFLSELSKQYSDDTLLIIMDSAGWHKSKALIIPSNIKLTFLPPYSPELNPVETLWLYIKKSILANKFYDTIESLEDALCQFIHSLSDEIVKQICKTSYLTY